VTDGGGLAELLGALRLAEETNFGDNIRGVLDIKSRLPVMVQVTHTYL